jgi:hypothetical protein
VELVDVVGNGNSMSWPELIFYGTIVIGIVGAPFLLLRWLYRFSRRVIEHVRRREPCQSCSISRLLLGG